MANDKSITLFKKTTDGVAAIGAHVVAPATVGAVVVGGGRALVRGKDEMGRYSLSIPWAIGGAVAGIALNAGLQLGAKALEDKAVKAAADADAKRMEQASA